MTANFTPEQKLAQIEYLLFRMQRESKVNRVEITRALGFLDDLRKHVRNGGEPCESNQSNQ